MWHIRNSGSRCTVAVGAGGTFNVVHVLAATAISGALQASHPMHSDVEMAAHGSSHQMAHKETTALNQQHG
jgi:hypothetical protein